MSPLPRTLFPKDAFRSPPSHGDPMGPWPEEPDLLHGCATFPWECAPGSPAGHWTVYMGRDPAGHPRPGAAGSPPRPPSRTPTLLVLRW